MASYVTVPDLIRNGGDGCTVLHQRKPPYTDHVVIVENECDCAHRGSVTITHNGETIVWRCMRGQDIMDPLLYLTVGDLNDARMALLEKRLCKGCRYFDECIYSGIKLCLCNGNDNWANYKAGSCPCKEEERR